MTRIDWLRTISLVVAIAAASAAPAGEGEKKNVKVIQQWSGSVEDAKLMKDAPAAITNMEQLAKIWKAWKVEGDVPMIDFKKNLVVGTYTSGGRLNLVNVKLDEKGNLEMLAIATRDFRPGFRFVLAQVSNEGVKSVSGKKLP